MKDNFKEAGLYLKEQRKKTGLSIFKIANKIGISGNYISLVERGLQVPSDIVLYKFSEVYNVDKNILFSLFNKLEPKIVEEILSHPNLINLITQLLNVDDFSEEEECELYNILLKTIDEYTKEKNNKI